MEVKPFKDRKDSRKEQVRDMFNDIAGSYDFLNHFLSFNTDRKWRRKLVRMVDEDIKSRPESGTGIKILDVATGTGDLAFALSEIGSVHLTGLDLSEEMLNIARKKSASRNKDIIWQVGDSENLPFKDESFDFVTVAFGVRNYEDLFQGLKEMIRTLKPGGTLLILEFSKPGKGIFSMAYSFYSKKILPVVASIFTREPRAYTYLPDSIDAFPSGDDMLVIMRSAGLGDCNCQRLTGGVASIYSGTKSSAG